MKTLRVLAVLIGACLVPVLSGCSWLDFRRGQDSSPPLREALEVPPDLTRPATADPLALPGAKPSATASAAPSATATVATTGGTSTTSRVTLERDGAQRWLVAQESPESLWPKVRDYFLRNNMRLVLDNPQTRVLETEWIERPVDMGGGWLGTLVGKLHSTGIRDKFRVRIEPGRTPGTSEVYVSQQGMEEVVAENAVNVAPRGSRVRPIRRWRRICCTSSCATSVSARIRPGPNWPAPAPSVPNVSKVRCNCRMILTALGAASGWRSTVPLSRSRIVIAAPEFIISVIRMRRPPSAAEYSRG
jgi:hypothetical protein